MHLSETWSKIYNKDTNTSVSHSAWQNKVTTEPRYQTFSRTGSGWLFHMIQSRNFSSIHWAFVLSAEVLCSSLKHQQLFDVQSIFLCTEQCSTTSMTWDICLIHTFFFSLFLHENICSEGKAHLMGFSLCSTLCPSGSRSIVEASPPPVQQD